MKYLIILLVFISCKPNKPVEKPLIIDTLYSELTGLPYMNMDSILTSDSVPTGWLPYGGSIDTLNYRTVMKLPKCKKINTWKEAFEPGVKMDTTNSIEWGNTTGSFYFDTTYSKIFIGDIERFVYCDTIDYKSKYDSLIRIKECKHELIQSTSIYCGDGTNNCNRKTCVKCGYFWY